jgi:hypothetical protein
MATGEGALSMHSRTKAATGIGAQVVSRDIAAMADPQQIALMRVGRTIALV